MQHSTRHKLTTGAGILAMVAGALLLVAPGAGAHHVAGSPSVVDGNPSCASLGYTTEVKFDDPVPLPNGGPTSGISYTSYVDSSVLHFDWTSTQFVIEAVITKQGNGAGIFTTGGTFSGTAWVVPNNSENQAGISHLSFCHNGQTTTTVQETTTTVEETTTTVEETTTTTEDIEVLEDVVENTTTTALAVLPTTGSGTSALGGLGVALLAAGAGLALASRRLALTQG